MRRRDFILNSPVLAVVAALTACSGGSGGAEVTTASGVFKDANVAGMSYVSGKQEGVTGADSSFTYEVGKDVSFFLGGLALGSVPGRAVITPLDLVRNGASSDIAVLNRVRFLLVLDDDDDPANGIRISTDVQRSAQVATSIWKPVDFSVDETALAAELNLVIFDLIRLEGAQQIPTAAEARTHLEATLRCVRSGAFRGTLAGGDTGNFGVMVDAETGELRGYASRSGSQALIALDGTEPVSLDQETFFISDDAATGATFTGRLTDPDNITGAWEFAAAQQPSGTFLGRRIGGTGDATYRFTASYEGSDAGVYTFDISATGGVTGTAYNAVSNELNTLTGTLNNNVSLLATTSNQMSVTATVDLTAGTLSGGDTQGNTITGSGCRLN